MDPKPGYFVPWLRTHMTRAAVAINLYFAELTEAEPQDEDTVDACSASSKVSTNASAPYATAIASVAAFCLAARDSAPRFEGAPAANGEANRFWVKQVRARAASYADSFPEGHVQASMAKLCAGKPTVKAPDLSKWTPPILNPSLHYSKACTLLSPLRPGGEAPPSPRYDEAIQHLRLAQLDPALNTWMTKDPQLASFMARDEGAEFRSKPTDDLFALKLFAAHKDRLKLAGLTSFPAFEWLTTDDYSEYLSASRRTRDLLEAAVRLGTSLSPELRDFTIPILKHLEDNELLSYRVLTQLDPAARQDLADKLTQQLKGLYGWSPAHQFKMTKWLADLSTLAGGHS